MPKFRLTNSYVQALAPKVRPYEVTDTIVTRLFVRVQLTGLKTYYIGYNIGFIRKRVKLERADTITVTQARDRAKDYLAKLTLGDDPHQLKKDSIEEQTSPTLKYFLNEKYKTWIMANKKSGDTNIKRIEAAFALLLTKRLNDIDIEVIDTWKIERLKRNAPQTINRDVTCLRSCINKAVAWGIVKENKMKFVESLKVDKKKKKRILTKDEEIKVKFTLDSYDSYLKLFVLLAFATAMRKSEITNLEWLDINLDKHELRVKGENAKSSQTRIIPLNDNIIKELLSWKEKCSSTRYVFPSPRSPHLPISNPNNAFSNLLTKAGIKNFTFHGIRHTVLSRLANNPAIPPPVAMKIAGHSSIETTMLYVRVHRDSMKKAVETLGEW